MRLVKLLPVAPVGTSEGVAIVDGALFRVPLPLYPATPERIAFRRARIAANINLRVMAMRLGIAVTALSDVERGAKRPESWGAFFEAAGLTDATR